MPPNRFESEVESFLEGSHGDRTHIKRADHPRLHHYAGRYSPAGCTVLPVPSTPPVVGLLHDTKPSHSVLLARELVGMPPRMGTSTPSTDIEQRQTS